MITVTCFCCDCGRCHITWSLNNYEPYTLNEFVKMLTDKYCRNTAVRPLLIIGVERDYLRGTICLVPSLTAVHVSSVHVYLCA